ncbi:MAG: FUSC family protein, partial [Rhodanobacter sp.]
ATPPALFDLASALFANGNRLARTAMSFEALLDEHESLPEEAAVCHFIEHAAKATHALAEALQQRRAPAGLPDLRPLQHELAQRLAVTRDHGKTELLARISDRLTDNVNTLAHVIGRSPQLTMVDDRHRTGHVPGDAA